VSMEKGPVFPLYFQLINKRVAEYLCYTPHL
jgi:hypothetical protein